MAVRIKKKGDVFVVTGGLKVHQPIAVMNKADADTIAQARRRLVRKRKSKPFGLRI